jgi:RNA polymerase sigma factor (sigma-70 family)
MVQENDQVLLRAYARDRCEASFSEIVHRHVDFVHSTAWRILRDSGLAEEVTQRVFLALAQHSAKLQERASITGWLHETARNLAINTVRSEERRRQREKETAAVNPPDTNDAEEFWGQLAPRLDEALAQLNAIEREVLLWRYFERRTAEQIGERLGLTAEAAQKRVARALDRLRGILAQRGLSAPAANLAALLSTHAVQSAPVGLAAAAITAASSASAAFPAGSTLQILMTSTKVKLSVAALLAASVTTPLVLQYQANARLREQVAQLRAEQGAPPPAPPATAVSDASEFERLRNEHTELLRLRGQVTQLRQQLASEPKTDSKGANRNPTDNRLTEEMENANRLLAKSPEIPLIRTNDFRNAGYATAEATFHTLNWAQANHDTNAFLKAAGLEPEARQRADELFAQMPEAVRQRYGSVDALLVDWAMKMAEPPEAYRILSQREDGPDAASLTVQFQYPNSRVRENEASFYRDQDGNWRRAIPAGVVEKLPNVINNQAPATAAAAPR